MEALIRRRVDERPVAGFNLVAVADGAGICLHYDGELRVAEFGRGLHVVSTDRDLDEPRLSERLAIDRVRVAGPLSADPAGLAGFLGSHEGERPVCKHGERFGTVSSTVFASGPSGSRLWYADGPPCRTPFRDLTGILA